MDNTGNFEQQFTQNVKATATQPVYEAQSVGTTGNSKLLIAITIALAAIVLVESIALVLTLSNYFSYTNAESGGEENEASYEENTSNPNYSWDESYNLTAMNLTCTAEDGSYFTFDLNNKYEEHNSTSAIASLGSYAITNGSLVSLSNSGKVLYYDGWDIADGLTIYKCEENVTESDAE